MTAWASALADRFDPPPAPHQHDPAGWIRTKLGEHTWSMQNRVLDAVATHPKVAVKASHGVGKSWLAGRAVSWWIDQHPPGSAFAATTAPTFAQVAAILWKEINRAANRADTRGNPLPGRILQTEWKIGRELVAYGRKPANTDEHGFQGIHAEHVLVVVDEACGIADNVWEGVESITTSESSRILAIGNPTDPSARFARMCRPGSGWHVLHIDALATPNITRESLTEAAVNMDPPLSDELLDKLLAEVPDDWDGEVVPDELTRSLTSAWWVVDKVRTWGIGSQLWQGKVRGQFPEAGDDTLIPLSWVEKAQQAELDSTAPPELAVDVARYGSDETVMYERRGPILRPVATWQHASTVETARRVEVHARSIRARTIRVDGVGVGGGVVDQLIAWGLPAVDLQAGSSPMDGERFVNARAEWYWGLRERFESGDIDIHDDDVLAGQLSAIKYSHDARGRIKIESKDDMKDRGMPSPDRADCAMMAYAHIPEPEDLQDEVYESIVEISLY